MMIVSSLELCSTSVIIRAFCEDSSPTEANIILDKISRNRSLDLCLEIILKRIVKTQPDILTDRLLCALLGGSIHLKSLELRKCTNVSMVGLSVALKCQPCIEFLDLSKCNQLTHPSIADILAKGTPILKSLIFESCLNMKDSTVQAILQSCSQLTFISLACSPFVTDDMFNVGSKDGIHEHNIALSLTGIDISGCKNISATTVRHLSVLCGPNLRRVNISWTNIDCMSLVYLSGYTLSSAVFLATNAHPEDAPFTVAELEASQQFEFQMIQKHASLLIQTTGKSLSVDNESNISINDARSEEKPMISHKTDQEYSVLCDHVKVEDELNYACKQSQEDSATMPEENPKHESSHMGAISLPNSSENQDKHFQSKTDRESLIDVCINCGTARLHFEANAAESNVKDIAQKDTHIQSKCMSELVAKADSLSLNLTCNKNADICIEVSSPMNESPEICPKLPCQKFFEGNQISQSSNEAQNTSVKATSATLEINQNKVSNVHDINDSLANHPVVNGATSIVVDDIYIPRQMFDSHITELDISEIKFYDDYKVGSDCLMRFVSSNHLLHTLKISWKDLDDSLLGFVAKNEPDLTIIGLVDCESLSDSGLKMLGEYCKKIYSIDLQGVPFVGDEGLYRILKNGSVCKLSLAECAVTDITLRNIVKFCSSEVNFLDLSWCENITDRGIANMIISCPNLEYLDLRQCNASEKSIEALKENGECLTYLGLCSIQDITDKMTIPLVQNMKYLTFIDLSWNCMLTDDTISTLFISCVMLVEVSLSGLKRITSKPFLPIISGLAEWRSKRQVITNRLRRRGIVTRDLGLQEVYEADFYIPYRSLHYVPDLQKIDVSFSDKINDIHLAEIVSVCRGTLKIEDYYSVPIKPRWR